MSGSPLISVAELAASLEDPALRVVDVYIERVCGSPSSHALIRRRVFAGRGRPSTSEPGASPVAGNIS